MIKRVRTILILSKTCITFLISPHITEHDSHNLLNFPQNAVTETYPYCMSD